MSDSLRPHGLQHTRFPCPSPSPRVCSNSCPLRRWSHSTISFSVISFSSCPHSFPTWGSFPVSQLFVSGDQNMGGSASASGLPMNIQCWFPLGFIGLISSLFQESSPTPWFKASIFWCLTYVMVQLSHPYMTTEKNIALIRWTFVRKVMSLLFNTLCTFDITFLPRSKHLLIFPIKLIFYTF